MRPAAENPAETDAKRLIRFGTESGELFHDPGGRSYAQVRVDGHHENHLVRGSKFKQFLKLAFYESTGRTPSPETSRSALEVLEILAAKGPCHDVHVRTARVADPDDPFKATYYLDLADDLWRAVRITPEGWEVVDHPPVRFLRPQGMLPLPEPVRGGLLKSLWQFINIKGRDRRLYQAWLTAAVRCRGPYPILIGYGEQGTAKSTTCKVTRKLIDPHITPLRSLPREERDLMIGATHSGMLAYDNVSNLSPEMSDSLCRIATGAGFATRQLYSDDEETHLAACRPILINGIEELASRGDLLQAGDPDRTGRDHRGEAEDRGGLLARIRCRPSEAPRRPPGRRRRRAGGAARDRTDRDAPYGRLRALGRGRQPGRRPHPRRVPRRVP